MIRLATRSCFALCTVLAVSSAAASNEFASPRRRVRVEVTPAGAFYRVDDVVCSVGSSADRTRIVGDSVDGACIDSNGATAGHAIASSADGSVRRSSDDTSDLVSGVIWTHADGGLGWIPASVSLGDFGSQVAVACELNNQRVEALSSFDTNPPTPLWNDLIPASTDQHVAAASTTNTVVSLCEFDQAMPSSTAVLRKFSSSATPDWTYTFALANLNGGTNVGISRDGQTIVAAVSRPSAGSVDITVFSPSSGTPLSYTTIALSAVPDTIRGFDLSADGSTLYFSSSSTPTAYVFDVATQSVVFSTPLPTSFDSHAISGDGSVFAYGAFNSLVVWEKSGATYVNTFTRTVPGSNYCSAIDISDDGTTIAYGFTFYDSYQTVRIEALDVPTHAVTMSDVATSTVPTLQNIVSSISISADGQRFAVGLWGDGSGPLAEGRLYARDRNAPVGTLDVHGSIFTISISADGQRFAAGSKAVHANQQGNGGEVDLVGGDSPFTSFCYQNGALDTPCPCGNSGVIGHGCNNSRSSGGALLTAAGSVDPDSVVLTSSSELPAAMTIFMQGQTAMTAGTLFGDGVRCVDTNVKRLAIKYALDGTAVFPEVGDPSIGSQSSALGDPIMLGTSRYYQAYYRDPVSSFCAPPLGDDFNSSNAVRVDW
jgi:hypothetical protein